MKSEKNILIAFILNLLFSIFELAGGLFIGSIAIISDSIHDAGDAISLGFSYFFEKKSKNMPDEKFTFGYIGYSVIGGAVTSIILLFSSTVVIFNSINRILNPSVIDYNGMIIFSIIGTIINIAASTFTHHGHSINEKAVNLHLIEDALGWIIVLIGAVIMKYTDITIIDPIISLFMAIFILYNALKLLKEISYIVLHKVPENIEIDTLKKAILNIEGIIEVFNIHVWTIDGKNNYASLHVIAENNYIDIKNSIREIFEKNNVNNVTIEFHTNDE